MADSSRTQLFYAKESNWGEVPSSAMTELRFTGEGLGYTIDTTTSNEVRSDRQITDLIQTSSSATGNVNLEWSYGAYDDLIESAFYSAWSDAIAISASGDIAADDAGAFTSGSTDFVSSGIVLGQWIKVSGFQSNGGENNGIYRVTSVSSGRLDVDPAPASSEVAGGLTVSISGSMIRNGVAETSLTLEKEFGDIGQFMAFTGMVANQMSLDVSSGSVLTGSFTFTGSAATLGSSSAGTGTPIAPAVGEVMNAVDSVGDLREAGVEMTGVHVQQMSIQLANQVRPISAVGSLGAVDMGAGRCTVTGSVAVYFVNGDLYAKYLAGTSTSLSFRTTDRSGNAYVISLPHIKISSGAITAGGADQDVIASFDYQALRDPATDCTIQIDRLPA